jgi:hypothetical protein
MFKDTADAVLWMLDKSLADPIRSNWDNVGRLDEATTTTNDIKTKEDCFHICSVHSSTCLAWTWEVESEACHVSLWIIVGHAANGKYSGVNVPRAINQLNECP